MIDLPNSATFAAALAEPRLYAGDGRRGAGRLVRGFSGFGGAMIYMPLIAAIYDPRIAAVTILLVDFVSQPRRSPFPRCAAAPGARSRRSRSPWRSGLPLGTWALIVLDPIVLRWCIAIVVLSLVPLLASGWRYHGQPRLPVTLGVGLFAGVSAGAVLIAGPPVILYWLGGGNSAITMRANLMVFFMICDVLLVAIFGYDGLFEARPLALSLLLGVPFFVRHGDRRALLPRHVGPALPAHRLRHHRARGSGQPADTRPDPALMLRKV